MIHSDRIVVLVRVLAMSIMSPSLFFHRLKWFMLSSMMGVFLCVCLFACHVSATEPNRSCDSENASHWAQTEILPVVETRRSSPQSKLSAVDLGKLIDQLNSREFNLRETASRELIAIGEEAIGPLALTSFKCSPECCWRIKKTLEGICTGGDETVFYKAAGVLQLRFESDNAEMNQRLASLKSKWQNQRKQEAISQLRKVGAQIVDPWEGSDPRIPQPEDMQWVGGGNLIIINGQVNKFNLIPGPVEVSQIRKSKKPLSESEQKRQIKEILESDLAKARQLVLGDNLKADGMKQTRPDPIQFQNRMIMRAGRDMVFPVDGVQGVVVELGEQWRGSDEDFEKLSEISNLTQMTLRGLTISKEQLNRISAVSSMSKLLIEDCQITPTLIKDSSWSLALRELEFADQVLSTELIESINSVPSIQRLTLKKCGFAEVDFQSLKGLTELRGIHLDEVSVPAELFEVIAGLKQLTYVDLSGCKFETTDYRLLKENRPNLRMTFTNQAFLGVRGPLDMFQGSEIDLPCEISEVVAGSGADKAGMKVGDVIQTVNGEKIEAFEDLRLHIARYRPGETLQVLVNRAGQAVRLEVNLTRFDSAND